MKIAVVIATTGRPKILTKTLERLSRQTRQPDAVLVVCAFDGDFTDRRRFESVQLALSEKGSSRQRNLGLEMLGANHDVIVFLDDDFFPARDFIAGCELLMTDHPDVVAASGRVLADGFRSAGISFEEADALIDAYEREDLVPHVVFDQVGAYGCNMIIRTAARPDARFDENLPLFGWLEDLDYSSPFAKVGRIVETNRCVGVHLGVKSGRTSGVLLGYSQIANPLYLASKGTMGLGRARGMAIRNVVANVLRSVAPESYVDRRGRLKGNLAAISDLIRGKCHPTRVLDLAEGAKRDAS